MEKNERKWEVALHESGHVRAAMVLTPGRMTCQAVLLPSGGGNATVPNYPDRFKKMVILAAGKHAETLSDRFEPPELSAEEKASDGKLAWIQAQKEAVEHAEEARRAKNESDDFMIAKTCASYHPTEPEEWVYTFHRIHRQAKNLIAENEADIVAMAQRLYRQGVITVGEDDEQEFESRQSAAACRENNTGV